MTDKDKPDPAARNLPQNMWQQLHVHMGEPADKDVARRRANNKAARKSRRTNRRGNK